MSKIAAIVATRGRPRRAAAVIECARNMTSGQHDVAFIAALDADDRASVDFFSAYEGVISCVQPRPKGVGDCWNIAASEHEADIYAPLTDDAWVVTPGWDALMVNALSSEPLCEALGLIGWTDLDNPHQVTLYGMASKWLAMNDGVIFDARFPFWFGDTAVNEVAIFATGQGLPQLDRLRFVSRPGNINPRLRDMDVWWSLFAATRHERIATGKCVRHQMGLAALSTEAIAELVRVCEQRDKGGRLEAPAIQASIKHPAPATEEYLAAKADALAYIERNSRPPRIAA